MKPGAGANESAQVLTGRRGLCRGQKLGSIAPERGEPADAVDLETARRKPLRYGPQWRDFLFTRLISFSRVACFYSFICFSLTGNSREIANEIPKEVPVLRISTTVAEFSKGRHRTSRMISTLGHRSTKGNPPIGTSMGLGLRFILQQMSRSCFGSEI